MINFVDNIVYSSKNLEVISYVTVIAKIFNKSFFDVARIHRNIVTDTIAFKKFYFVFKARFEMYRLL